MGTSTGRPVRAWARDALSLTAVVLTVPLWLPARLQAWLMGGETVFAACSELLSLVPGLPGVVLRRPVGSSGAFSEHAALPKDLPVTVSKAEARPAKPAAKAAPKTKQPADREAARRAALAFEKEEKRREGERRREEQARARERERRERAIAAAAKAWPAWRDKTAK